MEYFAVWVGFCILVKMAWGRLETTADFAGILAFFVFSGILLFGASFI